MTMERLHRLGRAMFDHYWAGRYAEALAVVETIATEFPERDDETTFYFACLRQRLGDQEAALRTLEDGLARGLWWGPELLALDDDLAPLRETPRFQTVLEECGRRLAAKPAEPWRAPVILEHPSPRAVLMAVHGRNGNADDFINRWTVAPRCTIIAPRSTQRFGMRSFSWDDPARGIDDIRRAYEDWVSTTQHVGLPLVTAGFSQGAALAIAVAVTRQVPATGFLAVAPSAELAASLIDERASSDPEAMRGYIVVGDRDPHRESSEGLAGKLREHGVDLRLEVVSDLDHRLPPDFDHRLPTLVGWLTEAAVE